MKTYSILDLTPPPKPYCHIGLPPAKKSINEEVVEYFKQIIFILTITFEPELLTGNERVEQLKSNVHPEIWKTELCDVLFFQGKLIVICPEEQHKEITLYLSNLRCKRNLPQ